MEELTCYCTKIFGLIVEYLNGYPWWYYIAIIVSSIILTEIIKQPWKLLTRKIVSKYKSKHDGENVTENAELLKNKLNAPIMFLPLIVTTCLFVLANIFLAYKINLDKISALAGFELLFYNLVTILFKKIKNKTKKGESINAGDVAEAFHEASQQSKGVAGAVVATMLKSGNKKAKTAAEEFKKAIDEICDK